MKDFFDLAMLSHDADIGLDTLRQAIHATFSRRKTDLPTDLPTALTDAFWSDEAVKLRWTAFVRKNNIQPPLNDLEMVCQIIAAKVGPILSP